MAGADREGNAGAGNARSRGLPATDLNATVSSLRGSE